MSNCTDTLNVHLGNLNFTGVPLLILYLFYIIKRNYFVLLQFDVDLYSPKKKKKKNCTPKIVHIFELQQSINKAIPYKGILITRHSKANIYNIAEHGQSINKNI